MFHRFGKGCACCWGPWDRSNRWRSMMELGRRYLECSHHAAWGANRIRVPWSSKMFQGQMQSQTLVSSNQNPKCLCFHCWLNSNFYCINLSGSMALDDFRIPVTNQFQGSMWGFSPLEGSVAYRSGDLETVCFSCQAPSLLDSKCCRSCQTGQLPWCSMMLRSALSRWTSKVSHWLQPTRLLLWSPLHNFQKKGRIFNVLGIARQAKGIVRRLEKWQQIKQGNRSWTQFGKEHFNMTTSLFVSFCMPNLLAAFCLWMCFWSFFWPSSY